MDALAFILPLFLVLFSSVCACVVGGRDKCSCTNPCCSRSLLTEGQFFGLAVGVGVVYSGDSGVRRE